MDIDDGDGLMLKQNDGREGLLRCRPEARREGRAWMDGWDSMTNDLGRGEERGNGSWQHVKNQNQKLILSRFESRFARTGGTVGGYNE